MRTMAGTFALLGMGRTGKAAQAFLRQCGFATLPVDDHQEAFRAPLEDVDIHSLAGVVVSPGVPFDHPWVQKARAVGIPVLSDMDLFRRVLPEAFVVGVTGTNGKSTTTALIHHILSLAFPHVILGGNIGVPVLEAVSGAASPEDFSVFRRRLNSWLEKKTFEVSERDRLLPLPGDPRPLYVLELSSYQLAWSHALGVDIALWSNLTPDHLDHHGTLEAYSQAKQKIFDGASWAVVAVDDVPSREVYRALLSGPLQVIGVHVQQPGTLESPRCEAFVDEAGTLTERGPLRGGPKSEGLRPALSLESLSPLKGRHNWQNMTLAVEAARILHVPEDIICRGLQTFQGLPHRLEEVGCVHVGTAEIRFLNDSKATNAESLIKALESFPRVPIYLLAGGRAKSDGVAPAVPFMTSVRKVFLFGEATNRFEKELETHVPSLRCGDLETALRAAWALARQEMFQQNRRSLILLSPACASFDQFPNYEVRGDVFREAVQKLLGEMS